MMIQTKISIISSSCKLRKDPRLVLDWHTKPSSQLQCRNLQLNIPTKHNNLPKTKGSKRKIMMASGDRCICCHPPKKDKLKRKHEWDNSFKLQYYLFQGHPSKLIRYKINKWCNQIKLKIRKWFRRMKPQKWSRKSLNRVKLQSRSKKLLNRMKFRNKNN